MKKYEFTLNHYASSLFFPEERVKNKIQIIEILMEATRYILSASDVKTNINEGKLILIVDKMSRLFFCNKNKYYSIVFPFAINEYDDKLLFSFQNDIDVDAQLISSVISVIKSDEFDSKSSFDFIEPIYYIENELNENFWIFLKELLLIEDGYIRYDNDETGYEEAKKNGHEYTHPINHLDIFYSSKATFKLGLDHKIIDGEFIDCLNTKTNCKFIKDKIH